MMSEPLCPKVNTLKQPLSAQSTPSCNELAQHQQQPSHYVVEEEYTIRIPLIRPTLPFLAILKKGGATGEVFTKKEICHFLKTYIGSRQMFDITDPRVVYCDNDPLGKVFGVTKFTIGEVVDLIVKNCTPVPDTCIKRRCHLVSQSLSSSSQCQSKQESTSDDCKQILADVSTADVYPASSFVPPSSILSKITAQDCNLEDGSVAVKVKENLGAMELNIKNSEKGSSDSSDSLARKRSSVSIKYNDKDSSTYPWYFQVKMTKDEESEVHSVQSKSTVPIEDSSDDLWFVEEDTISVQYESDVYELEYEVISDVAVTDSDTDDVYPDIAVADVLVVCRDSDKEFWADSSGIDSDTDTEFTDADKWICECSMKNHPIQRYCCHCWKLRPSWLPEKIASSPETAILYQQPGSVSSANSSTVQETENPSKQCEPFFLFESTNVNEQNLVKTGHLKRQNSKTTTQSVTSGLAEVLVTSGSTKETLLKSIDLGICASLSSNQEVEPSSSFMSSSDCEMPKSLHDLGSRTSLSNVCHKTAEKTPSSKQFSAQVDSSTSSSESPCINSPPKKLKLVNWAEKLATWEPSDTGLCAICMAKPKTGSIIHGSSGHQIACYECAKTLKKRGKSCPVCRRTIQKVVKNYIL